MLDKYRVCNNDENKLYMVKARSNYKKTIRQSRYAFDKEKTKKFCDSKYKNAKLYWNMLKELSYVKPANIVLSSFEEYFKSVNNPDDPFYSPDEDILDFNERYVQEGVQCYFRRVKFKFFRKLRLLGLFNNLKTNRSWGTGKAYQLIFYTWKTCLSHYFV